MISKFMDIYKFKYHDRCLILTPCNKNKKYSIMTGNNPSMFLRRKLKLHQRTSRPTTNIFSTCPFLTKKNISRN